MPYDWFVQQSQWIPICPSDTASGALGSTGFISISPEVVSAVINNTTPTPSVPDGSSCLAGQTTYVKRLTPIHMRANPLPVFDWPDSREVWERMHCKEELPDYSRDLRLFENHPSLQPRMRAILLDWLNEVSCLVI